MNTGQEGKTEYDAAFEAGVALAAGRDIAQMAVTATIIPEGYEIQSLERFQLRPSRRRAEAVLTTVDSFARYFKDFGTFNSQIFADPSTHAVKAVLDYHDTVPDKPSWCSDKAVLHLSLSLQWRTWKSNHNKALSQVQFAEFLEDNSVDIVEPDGAAVLECAMNLEARKTVKFKSAVNLDNGAAQFTYDEAVEGKGKGLITVPTRFVLRLPIFEGGEPVDIQARLRYRIKDDALTFTYLMDRPERLLKDAFDAVLLQIEQATGVNPFIGSVSTS
jgi:uncharacterized protein YfdQ (DUF2303 family)